MKYLTQLIFGVSLIFLLSTLTATSSYAQAITDDLKTRPDPAGTQTQVKMAIMVLDIDSINGATQTFTANVVVIAEWKDIRLAGGARRSKVSLDQIWNPQLQVVNQQKMLKTLPDTAEVEPDGTIRFIQRYWGVFSNPLNLQDFPLDQHDFSIRFTTAAGEIDEIEMIASDEEHMRNGLAEKLSLPDWEIVDWKVSNEPIELIAGLNKLPGFTFIFNARRHVGYYITKVLLPLSMIIMMSWIVFWIHPSEAGPQISVAVTSMLTLIAFRFAVGSTLPGVSYLTRMDGFILFSTILVFVALLEVILTSRLAKSGSVETALSIDKTCRVLFPMVFVVALLLVAAK